MRLAWSATTSWVAVVLGRLSDQTFRLGGQFVLEIELAVGEVEKVHGGSVH